MGLFAKYSICVVIFTILFSGCSQKQILIVEPTDTFKTKIRLYENGKFKEKFSVNVGRHGIAKNSQKIEGDGKTPSGEFAITTLFSEENPTVDMPLIKSEPSTICVDDTKSIFYNQIINPQTNKKDWDSFEYMKRDDGQYRYGAVIGYNTNSMPNLGSCIFIHIKKSENSPTAGCVALDEIDMKKLFFWLDAEKSPQIAIPQDEQEFAKFLQKFSLTD